MQLHQNHASPPWTTSPIQTEIRWRIFLDSLAENRRWFIVNLVNLAFAVENFCKTLLHIMLCKFPQKSSWKILKATNMAYILTDWYYLPTLKVLRSRSKIKKIRHYDSKCLHSTGKRQYALMLGKPSLLLYNLLSALY